MSELQDITHLPYGITQYYLPPDTSELNTPRLNAKQRPALNLPTPER